MKHACLAGALLLALSACGGGGGDTQNSSATPPVSTTPATPATPLAAYIGKWATSCAFHAIDTATITRAPGASEAISIAYQTDYYSNADCTGAVLGTFTQGASATAVYGGTVDAPAVLTEGAAPVVVQVDKVTTTIPPHTWTVTGTGVVHRVVNGYAEWCIDYANGDGACIADAGENAAGTVNPMGLTMQGNVLYELRSNASLYLVNKAFQRQ
jgi:hypothetical protein